MITLMDNNEVEEVEGWKEGGWGEGGGGGGRRGGGVKGVEGVEEVDDDNITKAPVLSVAG